MRSFLRVPRSRGTQAYVVLLLLLLGGLGLVALGHWRRGIVVIGALFLCSATLRALLSEEHKGMLGVRGRGFDIAWTTMLGLSLIVLGFIVPGGPEA